MTGTRWDIFCEVVDHYGDIGVSWRLARQLLAEHGLAVRLWVDDLATFHRLRSDVDTAADRQRVAGVDVRHWRPDADFGDAADVVVEAFGSRAPDPYLEIMAARDPKPAWINLEYLSAEDWIEDCHLGSSPHPRLPLVKHFFFPGFTARTGGVLCEQDLEVRRHAELASQPPRPGGVTSVSLFGYGGPAVPLLLSAWAGGSESILALVPESRILPDVLRFFGAAGVLPGARLERGALAVLVLPFQPLEQYDRLLWTCDVNFVRGEDSFVRAQWARRPFVWNIYPQEGGAHWAKLHAFVDRYAEGLSDEAAGATRELWRLWNRGETGTGDIGAAWRRFRAARTELEAHGETWATRLAGLGDLASNLVRFAAERL
jgi:uncharacterized repeat protein (TIGR03837 family)